jgi:hypothetical protein
LRRGQLARCPKGQAGDLRQHLLFVPRSPLASEAPPTSFLLISHALTFLDFPIAWPSNRFLQFQGIPRVSWLAFLPVACRLSPTSNPLSFTMADSWSDMCRQCVSTVAEAPAYILLGSLIATSIGVFILVSSSSLLPAGFQAATCRRRSSRITCH